MPTKLLTIPETAERLNYSRRQVYRLVNSGQLRAVRVNPPNGHLRVSEDEIERFVAGAEPAA